MRARKWLSSNRKCSPSFCDFALSARNVLLPNATPRANDHECVCLWAVSLELYSSDKAEGHNHPSPAADESQAKIHKLKVKVRNESKETMNDSDSHFAHFHYIMYVYISP